MIEPNRNIIKQLDALCASAYSFALYRVPWSDEFHFVLQEDSSVCKLNNPDELKNAKGFVFAPFTPSEQCPALLIKGDFTSGDWDEIAARLKELPAAPCPNTDALEPIRQTPQEEKEEYLRMFDSFSKQVTEKKMQKIVLARSSQTDTDKAFSPVSTFLQAAASYPRMFIYLVHTPVTGLWIGSTPELLISGQNTEWTTMALAGTMPVEQDVEPQLWDKKNREEQQYVTDYMAHLLKHKASKCDISGPYSARAGQLVHLRTDFRFQIKKPENIVGILQELHPSPAICGLPCEETRRFIMEHEGHNREYYAGYLGWWDIANGTDIYVNLRCIKATPNTTTFYAGSGLVAKSEAETEWEETANKMMTMKNVITNIEP